MMKNNFKVKYEEDVTRNFLTLFRRGPCSVRKKRDDFLERHCDKAEILRAIHRR